MSVETSFLTYQTTAWYHNAEVNNVNPHCYENLQYECVDCFAFSFITFDYGNLPCDMFMYSKILLI